MGCRDNGALARRVEALETETGEQRILIDGLTEENNLLAGSLGRQSKVVAELCGSMADLLKELQALRLLAHDHGRDHGTAH